MEGWAAIYAGLVLGSIALAVITVVGTALAFEAVSWIKGRK